MHNGRGSRRPVSSLYRPFFQRFKKWPNNMRGVTLSRLAPGSRRNLYGVVRLLYC
jgi:hypothetical protein